MGTEETRHDLWLKRINTSIAILGGSIASIAAGFNYYPSFFGAGPGNIAAVVRAQGGAPVSRAHVELLTSQNVFVGTAETDRDGRYVKKELEPGSYILKVSRGGYEPEVATVSVSAKKTTDLELVLRARSRGQAPPAQAAAGPPAPGPAPGNPLRSALEETGAAWIKNLGKSGR